MGGDYFGSRVARSLWAIVAGITAFGAILGLLGPFGSYAIVNAPLRVGYWIGVMWIGFAFYGLVVLLVLKLTRRVGPTFWMLLVAGALLASVPQAFVSRAVALSIGSGGATNAGLWYLQTALIGLLSTIGVALLVARRPAPLAPEAPRVDPLSRDVIALQMEDHYVRIHTAQGSRMELMTLAAAIARLEAVEGLQTHRSWWVARHAVARVEGTPRDMKLMLSNGLVAPVARSAVARLRSAGWIAGT